MAQNTPAPLLQRTAVISLATMASRLLGFVRDMLTAWLLGGSIAADALVVALRIPQTLRRLLADGVLSMTVTADIAAMSHTYDTAALIQAVQRRVAWLLCIVVGAGVIGAELLVRLLTPGVAAQAPLIAEATPLMRICLPYAFTASMAAFGMARLHLREEFLIPACMPVILNITILLFICVAFLQQYNGVGNNNTWAVLLACGVLCGGVAQWLWQAFYLHRKSAHMHHSPVPPPTKMVQRVLRHIPLGIFGAATPQLAMLVAMLAASSLHQGSMAALYYAERLMELPLAFAGAALGMGSLPTLVHQRNQGNTAAFCQTLTQTLHISLCITLPAAAGLCAVAMPLVQTLFAYGAFDTLISQSTVLGIYGYALGIPAYGLTRTLLNAAQTLQNQRLTVTSGLYALTLAALLCAVFAWRAPMQYAVLGVALGVSLGLWAQALILYCTLAKNLRSVGNIILPARSCMRLVGISFLTGLAAWCGTLATVRPWLQLIIAILVGIAFDITMLYLCKTEEWRLCQRLWTHADAPPPMR